MPESHSKEHASQENLPRRGQVRKLITSLIQSVPQGTHLTAQEVFQLAKETGCDLSLSTVYRTLSQLKAEGAISSVSGEHGVRYEPHDDDHDHLICLECGYTIEFVDDLLSGFGQVLARKNGYEFKSSRFDLYGLCQDCQSRSEDHKIRQAVASLSALNEQIANIESISLDALSQLEARKIDKGLESIESLVEALDELKLDLVNCLAKFGRSSAGSKGGSFERSSGRSSSTSQE